MELHILISSINSVVTVAVRSYVFLENLTELASYAMMGLIVI